MLQGYKKKVLEIIAQPLKHLAQAAEEIEKDPSTIWRWRQADPAFDEAVVETLAVRDEVRVQLADDSIFGRIVAGKAHAVTEIFWLKNKKPEKWSDRREYTGPNGGPLVPGAAAGPVVQTIMFGDVEVRF